MVGGKINYCIRYAISLLMNPNVLPNDRRLAFNKTSKFHFNHRIIQKEYILNNIYHSALRREYVGLSMIFPGEEY